MVTKQTKMVINQDNVIEFVTHVQIAAQRARDRMLSNIEDESLLEALDPWLWGPKCILIATERLLYYASEGGAIDLGSAKNLLLIMELFSPLLRVSYEIQFGDLPTFDFS